MRIGNGGLLRTAGFRPFRSVIGAVMMPTQAGFSVGKKNGPVAVVFSAVLTSSPGVPLRADWTVSSAVIAQTLGRPLSGNAANVTIGNIIGGFVFTGLALYLTHKRRRTAPAPLTAPTGVPAE